MFRGALLPEATADATTKAILLCYGFVRLLQKGLDVGGHACACEMVEGFA